MAKVATGFYDDGSLRSFCPREMLRVDGIPCVASLLEPVRLHSNGRLFGCRLALDTLVDDQALGAGRSIRLEPTGGLSNRLEVCWSLRRRSGGPDFAGSTTLQERSGGPDLLRGVKRLRPGEVSTWPAAPNGLISRRVAEFPDLDPSSNG